MRHWSIDVETVAIEDVATYLEPVQAPSNYRDEAKIEAFQREKQQELVDRAALDVDLARLVAIGWQPETSLVPEVRLIQTAQEEFAALAWFWAAWRSAGSPVLVTYNGLYFDLPVLLRRSLYLEVGAPPIQLDRFRHPQVIDLLQILSMDGRLKMRGLQFYANRFSLGGEPDIRGKDVGAAVVAGDWPLVRQHCANDVMTTMALARRMRLVGVAETGTAALF